MKIPFLWPALGFCLGIIAEKYCGKNFLLLWGISIFVISLIYFIFRRRSAFYVLVICLLAFVGNFYSDFLDRKQINKIENFISSDYQNVAGTVVSFPKIKNKGRKRTVSFLFSVKKIILMDELDTEFLDVSGKVQVFLSNPDFIPEVGDQLIIQGILKSPKGPLNPGEFNYPKYLASINVHAVLSSMWHGKIYKIGFEKKFLVYRVICKLRRVLAKELDKLYSAKDASILKAMLLGIRTGIDPELRDNFMKTGTVHLLAISGLHITLIVGTFYLLFIGLKSGQKRAAFFTLCVIGFYVCLAGLGIPVKRAGFIAAIVLIGILLSREVNLLNSLCFAFLCLLIEEPKALFSVSFQLSFISIFSIILITPFFRYFISLVHSIKSSLAVMVGIFPLIIYYFNIFSPMSVLANLCVIPFFHGALLSSFATLSTVWIPGISVISAPISAYFLKIGLWFINLFSKFSWGYWYFETPPFWKMFLYYGFLISVFTFWKMANRLKLFWCVGLISVWFLVAAPFFWIPKANFFRLTCFSAGQNELMHIHFPNRSEWLINSGRKFPTDQGSKLIAPYLKSKNIKNLDGIFFTDSYKKHTGGFEGLQRNFHFDNIIFPSFIKKMPDGFLEVIDKVSMMSTADKIIMGEDQIQVMATGERGIAIVIVLGEWRFLVISNYDSKIFSKLIAEPQNIEKIDGIFLPSKTRYMSEEILKFLKSLKPKFIIAPDLVHSIKSEIKTDGIDGLNLMECGSLKVEGTSNFLKITPFLAGKELNLASNIDPIYIYKSPELIY